MARCEICKKSPFETALHRINETGVEGIWRCKKHLPKGHKLTLSALTVNTV